MIFKLGSEFGVIFDVRMFVDLDHNRVGVAIVSLRPIFAVGDAAFDIWHLNHPFLSFPASKRGYTLGHGPQLVI